MYKPMRSNGICNLKAQSILEYLIVLTTILAAILFVGQGFYNGALEKGYNNGGVLLTDSTGKIKASVQPK